MKHHLPCALAAVLILASHAALAADDAPSPYVTDEEYATLVKEMDEAQDLLLGYISGLTDEQWNFKQNPSRWSVGECTEHIARSERALLEQVKQIIASPRDPEWFTRTKGKTDLLRQVVPNRGPQGQGGVQAPTEIRPSENWNRSRAIREFYAAHGEVRAFIEMMDRSIKDHTQESPAAVLGWMNAYDYLNIIPLHVMRHSKQILEVQQDANYPKAPVGTPQNAAAGKAPSPVVSDEEIAQLFKTIDEGQDMLVGLISGMTNEQWSFKQNPDRWSVAECVEHITRTEGAILMMVQQTLTGPRDPEWFTRTDGKLDLVRQVVPNRNPGGVGGFKAPFEVSPTQNWSREQAIREFYKSHGMLRSYVETMQRDIKDHTFENPFPQIGWLNANDWLNLAALHVMRHSKQIIEVQQDPNYPKATK